MDFIKLLDVANPKKIKDTINLLIENYEDFGDTVQAIADKAAEDSAAALLAGNEAKQIAQQNTEDLEEAIASQNTTIQQNKAEQDATIEAAFEVQDAKLNAQDEEIAEAIASQNTTIQQNKAEQDATIEAAFEVQDAKLNAQDEEIAQNTTTSDQAKQIAEEALAMIEQADARSQAATETAEDALDLANESIETSELAMNIATEAKSTVDQAISTGVFGTFVHNTAGVSLLHAYMTDNLNQENTDENFYMATPKLVRDALTDYYTKDEAAAKTDIPTEYLAEARTGYYFGSTKTYGGIKVTNNTNKSYGVYFDPDDFKESVSGSISGTGYDYRLFALKDVVRTTNIDQEIAGIKNYIGGLQKNSVDVATVSDIPTTLSELVEDTTHRLVTDTEKALWNAKSDFSGSYNDLTDKPTIPTTLAELTEDSTHRTVTDTEKSTWNAKSDFSGSYNDLTDKPIIPTALSELSEDSTHRLVTDNEKETWNAKSDFSGSYNDLTDKPIVPTININGAPQSTINFDSDPQTQLDNMVTLNTEQTITAPKNTQLSINWTDNINRSIALNKEIIVDDTNDHEITEKTTRHNEWNGSDGTGHITWTETQETGMYKKEVSLASSTSSDRYFSQTITQGGAFNLRSYYNSSTATGTRYARFEFDSDGILLGYRNGNNNHNIQIDSDGINISSPDNNGLSINGAPIMESGSNANGYWVRFVDGTQICAGRFTGNGEYVVTLPMNFINSDYFCAVFSEDTSTATPDIRSFACISRTTSTFTKGRTNSTFDFGYIAIGKWK